MSTIIAQLRSGQLLGLVHMKPNTFQHCKSHMQTLKYLQKEYSASLMHTSELLLPNAVFYFEIHNLKKKQKIGGFSHFLRSGVLYS